MERPDFALYVMSFIKDYDYPLIHSMNPEEITEVFHISNRCFLVSWALILLDQQNYENVLKGREQDTFLLADLVYCHGFCTEAEKLGFLNGDLSVEEQVKILYRMFKFIERQKKAEKLVDAESVTLEDLHALRNINLNLFPAFGEIRTLSEQERQSKIKEIQIKIEQLTSDNGKVTDHSDSPKVSEIKKEYIKGIINDINENVCQFDRVVKVIGKEASSKVEPNYKINPTCTDLLKSCTDYLKTVTQYIEDLKTINDFVIEDIQVPSDVVSPLVEVLAEQMQGIGL